MLKERIKILHGANMITDDIAQYVYHVIDMLSGETLDTDLVSMFTTHLAMASQRVVDKAELNTLDEMIWNEVKESAGFKRACDTLEQVEAIAPVKYPESEKQFILMHLCNLYQN